MPSVVASSFPRIPCLSEMSLEEKTLKLHWLHVLAGLLMPESSFPKHKTISSILLSFSIEMMNHLSFHQCNVWPDFSGWNFSFQSNKKESEMRYTLHASIVTSFFFFLDSFCGLQFGLFVPLLHHHLLLHEEMVIHLVFYFLRLYFCQSWDDESKRMRRHESGKKE